MTHLALLLADPSPNLRRRVLLEILDRPPDDPEVAELEPRRQRDPLVSELLTWQDSDGSWPTLPGVNSSNPVYTTATALARLGYLGFTADFPPVGQGADYLFSQQAGDGSWPLAGRGDESGAEIDDTYTMVPLQTALPLRGLARCGYATDTRSERGYAWLLDQQLDDGAWPTGLAGDNFGYVAGYRRLPHSRWGCRSNTTGALVCLALHPTRRHQPATRRGLDLLLGRDTRERHPFGFEVARLVGAEPTQGFMTFYARFDLAQILDLCWRIGADTSDPRVVELIAFAGGFRTAYGLWEYQPRPQASRWLTFDVLHSLRQLQEIEADTGDWFTVEPRTPFQTYPQEKKRF